MRPLARRVLTLVAAMGALAPGAVAQAADPYRFAPYADMAEFPAPDLGEIRTAGGVEHISLGFVTADEVAKDGPELPPRPPGTPAQGCVPTWGGYRAYAADGAGAYKLGEVAAHRDAGGDVVGSFGGQAGYELASVCTSVATLTAAYRKVIDTYDLTHVDFDIEGAIVPNMTFNTRRAQAIAALQAEAALDGRELVVSYTVAVEPSGLLEEGVALLQNAVDNGVRIDLVNLMTMDFSLAQVPEPATKMAQYSQLAALNAREQLRPIFPGLSDAQLFAKLGLTAMIGVNDPGYAAEVYTPRAASRLASWAGENGIGMLGMWALARDQSCTPELDPRHCSGITQAPWTFSHRLGAFAGPGMPPLPGHETGASAPKTAGGDFNGDGKRDLAIAVPGENDGAGTVHLLYGSASGLVAAGSQYWSQNAPGVPDAQEAGDGFGSTLAAGDVNGDGRADLAIGTPGENNGAGVVHVLLGSAAGLTATGSQLWSQASPGVANNAAANDHFGSTLAVGDFGSGAFADLAIGVPDEDSGALTDIGVVHVLPGSPSGPTSTGAQIWHQNVNGISDTTESGDRFGASLAAGSLGRSSQSDLAIGAPGENAGAGVAHAIYGSVTGLAAANQQLWSQDSAGVTNSAAAGDHFGAALAVGDFGLGAQQELAIGVPDEDSGALTGSGVVHVLEGTGNGLSTAHAQIWHQSVNGISDTAESGDRFGAALAAGDLGRTAPADLAVGAPGENAGAGVVHTIYGSATGLAASNQQLWSQDSVGIANASAPSDHFGATLAIADFGNSAFADLAIGAPDDDNGQVLDIGVLHVLPGSSAGATARPVPGDTTGAQYWTQNSGGITDHAELGDGFGGGGAR